MRQREETELFGWRIGFLCCAMVAALITLAFGFWNHQIVYSEKWTERAEQNRIREIPLVASRGRIYDRYGRLIADNRPSYNIVFIRENSPHSVAQTASMLASGIDVTSQDLLDRINRRLREPKFRPIILKEDISTADIAFVKSHRLELPEISVEFQPRRRYVGGELAAHVLGYVSEVTEAELNSPEFSDFKPGEFIGKAGLERQYNAVLRGKDGFKRVIVNSSGREMGSLQEEEPVPGNDLRTTLDLDLQQAAEDALGDRSGAVVALDPHTGEILALVSKPGYDPNLFASRISAANWNSLMDDPRKTLINRAIQSIHAPGSVFKPFIAAAALEAGSVDALQTYFCPGSATFYGHTYGCDKKHGVLNLHSAIVESCDVYFYNLGNKLGIDRISQFATEAGLGRKTGVDLPNEVAGLIPSQEWKQRVYKTKWYEGETISVSIGQGAVAVTPIQAAWAMGGLATGGRLKQPHLVAPDALKKVGFAPNDIYSEDYAIHESTVDFITSAMWGVVNEGGTGARAKVEGFDVAGKTGTAQVVSKQSGLKGGSYKDHAWFVGFAPYRDPEIVVAVFVENGGWGAEAAAPVAHAVLDTYYKKKTGHFEDHRTPVIAMIP